MKKGFTLIELLAVIVILAIIAVIATPIVLSIIKDSKLSSSLRSAENYLGAVNNTIIKEKLNDISFNPQSCEIGKDGIQSTITCNGTKLNVDINGTIPESGTITFKNNNIDIVDDLYIDGYYINGNINKLIETQSPALLCTLLSGSSQEVGSSYNCTLGIDEKARNLPFHVLEVKSDEIILLLDYNLNKSGELVTKTTLDKGTVAWDSSSNNQNGPTTVLLYLKGEGSKISGAVSNWTKLTWDKIDLPSKEQILNADSRTDRSSTQLSSYWLYSNLQYAEAPQYYWTSTADTGNIYTVYTVNFYGVLINSFSDSCSSEGVRPIIKIAKSFLN